MSIPKGIKKKLSKIVGKSNISDASCDRLSYAYDSSKDIYFPDAVLFPGNALEVSEILKLATKEGFFVIPRGAGTGTTGGSVPVKGGVVIVMSRLKRILEIDKDNLIVRAEPGVITGDLHRAVEKEGLFYPPDPSSSDFSTLGGNLAQCAGGPRAVKYGVTRDYVLGLEAVLPTGEIIKTGVETSKGVVGYDLTRLIVGSEGTLAVITSMVLKLLPLPESMRTMVAYFTKMDIAAETVAAIIKSGVVPRSVEYLDNASIKCVQDYIETDFPEGIEALLIIDVDGSVNETNTSILKLKEICDKMGAKESKIAESQKDVLGIREARKALSPAMFQYGPDKINEDIVVPRSKIPAMVRKIEQLSKLSGLKIVSFGHAGDGNIHVNIMLNKKNEDELKKAMSAVNELFDYTIDLGGTISGEHGVGMTKKPYISKEIGSVELGLMMKIKQVFDPKNILNPGKIF